MEISSALMHRIRLSSVPGPSRAYASACARRQSVRCFIRASCRVTLPSYTMLPTRATTPPMMDGSTRSVIVIAPPAARPSAWAKAARAAVAERHRGRDLGRDDLLRSGSTRSAERRGDVRHAARADRDRPASPAAADASAGPSPAAANRACTMPRFFSAGMAGVSSTCLSSACPAIRSREPVQLALGTIDVARPGRHVEQRRRVAARGRSRRHDRTSGRVALDRAATDRRP